MMSLNDAIYKLMLALVPMALVAIITISWNNSHKLTALQVQYEIQSKELDYQRRIVERHVCELRTPPT